MDSHCFNLHTCKTLQTEAAHSKCTSSQTKCTLLVTVECRLMLNSTTFDYCNSVWGNCGSTLQGKLQTLQNRAAQVLTFSNYDTNASHLFNILGWKNLKCQQQLQRPTMVYRSLHGLAPNYLSSQFEKRETIYCLRDSDNKLKVPLPRTNYYQRNFTYSSTTLWNSLPCQARQAESLWKFKYIIKQFF